MKFAHMADCHIGSWREPKLSNINTKAFVKAVNRCIDEDVDFILISGDLFNTSLPGIEKLKSVVVKLKQLSDKGIPVYIVAGSHDFSASGKTMLDVLESAGLVVNVVKGNITNGKLRLKFTVDKKTGAKITGMIGKKGMLERSYYEDLDRKHLEAEPGFKIFMFHTALTELKPKGLEKMDSAPVSFLPKGFDYYAAGHVHEVIEKELDGYRKIIYPGPLFPNNFRELEKLGRGGFYIYDEGELSYEPLQLLNVFPIELDCSNKTPEQVEQELLQMAKKNEFINTIVTIRLRGRLKAGRVSDIRLADVIKEFYSRSAYFVMKNTAALTTEEFEEIKIKQESVEDTEKALIAEHVGQVNLPGTSPESEKNLTAQLISLFNAGKKEGETKTAFESRIREDADGVLKALLEL
jgi:exonuclease SbcD